MNTWTKKNLNVDIELYEDNFYITITEPESGEKQNYHFGSNFSINEFVIKIGAEIWSWISLWKDEMKGE